LADKHLADIHIWLTECLFDTAMTISFDRQAFGRQTFGQQNVCSTKL
jgi:hypothetical protein